jgi:hypothetical protein
VRERKREERERRERGGRRRVRGGRREWDREGEEEEGVGEINMG